MTFLSFFGKEIPYLYVPSMINPQIFILITKFGFPGFTHRDFFLSSQDRDFFPIGHTKFGKTKCERHAR